VTRLPRVEEAFLVVSKMVTTMVDMIDVVHQDDRDLEFALSIKKTTAANTATAAVLDTGTTISATLLHFADPPVRVIHSVTVAIVNLVIVVAFLMKLKHQTIALKAMQVALEKRPLMILPSIKDKLEVINLYAVII